MSVPLPFLSSLLPLCPSAGHQHHGLPILAWILPIKRAIFLIIVTYFFLICKAPEANLDCNSCYIDEAEMN